MENNYFEKYSDASNCPVRRVMDRFGDKWSTLVLLILADEPVLRFNELSKAIPDISQKMLTTTLRSLESDGLVSRKVYAEVPPRVEYQLTEMGGSLVPHLKAVADWAAKNFEQIEHSRAEYSS